MVYSNISNSTSLEIFASIGNLNVNVSFADNHTLLSDNQKIIVNNGSFEIHDLHPGTLYNITVSNSSGIVETWVLPTRK